MPENQFPITLVCVTCHKQQRILLSKRPQLVEELMLAAKTANWKPIHDSYSNRSLIFCSDACYQAQLTKTGRIRKRLIRTDQ